MGISLEPCVNGDSYSHGNLDLDRRTSLDIIFMTYEEYCLDSAGHDHSKLLLDNLLNLN